MKLLELEPQFIRYEFKTETWTQTKDGVTSQVTGPREYHPYVDTIAAALGVMFLCPKCFIANKGNIGTHSIICWRPVVPQTIHPKPGRWEFHGTGYGDLTLTAGSSSVFLQGDGCKAHFFITKGEITHLT